MNTIEDTKSFSFGQDVIKEEFPIFSGQKFSDRIGVCQIFVRVAVNSIPSMCIELTRIWH